MEVGTTSVAVRNGVPETVEFGVPTPERTIRPTVEPEPSAPASIHTAPGTPRVAGIFLKCGEKPSGSTVSYNAVLPAGEAISLYE